jgi:hypothetical protein
MSSALNGLSDADALELLTGLHDLEKTRRVTRMAIAEVITLIGNMGFQINRPDDGTEAETTHNVRDVLAAINDQVVTLPRRGAHNG